MSFLYTIPLFNFCLCLHARIYFTHSEHMRVSVLAWICRRFVKYTRCRWMNYTSGDMVCFMYCSEDTVCFIYSSGDIVYFMYCSEDIVWFIYSSEDIVYFIYSSEDIVCFIYCSGDILCFMHVLVTPDSSTWQFLHTYTSTLMHTSRCRYACFVYMYVLISSTACTYAMMLIHIYTWSIHITHTPGYYSWNPWDAVYAHVHACIELSVVKLTQLSLYIHM